jgi:hypothetical protein
MAPGSIPPAAPVPRSPISVPPPRSRAARRGRTIAVVTFYGLLGAFCIACTIQVALQVFAVPLRTSPFASCQEGLAALAAGVERARDSAPGTDGEDRAIERFRRALEPDWGYRDGIAASCKGSPEDERSLDAIERLRYAEEHAVRREAGDLAPLRRRVQTIAPRDRPAPVR